MNDWLRDIFHGRPWWMNALMVFCAFMTFVYVPWDLFWKPVAVDEEVWFGFVFDGWAAKLMAIPHWFVYAAGMYGLRRMRPWIRTWGAAYVAQVSFGMLVWSISVIGGLLGVLLGLISALPFAALAFLLWTATEAFSGERAPLRERYGEWALVTGASAGIGAAFARALAREGLGVVLTARRTERLEALSEELQTRHGVKTRVVSADLAEEDAAERLAEAVSDLEIAVLVNNAGIGYAGRFDKLDAERVRRQIQVNCVAPVLLTRHLLPSMLTRGRGAVLVTGSVAAHQPLPLHGIYSATKAFVLFFGASLWGELRRQGIDVLVLEPGSTETEFQEVAGEIPHAGESPDEVVRVALDALGHQPSVIPGWLDWVRANAAQRIAPSDLVVSLAHRYMERQTPSEMR